MAEKNTTNLEREYTIPLREKCRPVPRYKKTPKAVKTVKEFIAKHMKIRDRDLNKIKIDKYLNEQLWVRGIKKPLHKVKVKAVKEGDIVRVYAVELPKKIDFKKIREEKQILKSKEAFETKKESKKSMMEKAKDSLQAGKETKDKNKDGVDDKVEEKEKQKAVEEVDKKEAKEEAKEKKHTTKVKQSGEKLSEVQDSD